MASEGLSLQLVNVKVSEDEMEAVVRVSSAGGSVEVTEDDVMKTLARNSITFGIDEDVIHRIVAEKLFNEDHIVARGRMPKIGVDTKTEFFFQTTPKKPRPIVLSDGSVDHYNLDTVEQVAEGDLLARMTPPTKGISGITVRGKELKTTDGRDFSLRAGINVTVSENGLEFYAKIAGYPKLIGTKVQVSNQYVVEGNVDFSTGNIQFDGDVMVKGDVLDGFSVTATGDIDVLGNIKNATIEAGGTINALGGIVAKEKGLVKAGRNINAIFVECGNLEAGDVIEVKSAIMHSRVKAGRAIICQEKKGLVVGGELIAGRLVQAKELGSDYATKTRVTIGDRQEMKRELLDLNQEIETHLANFTKLKENREKLEDNIEAVEAFLPVDEEKLAQLNQLLGKIANAQQGVVAQLRDLKDQKQVLLERIDSAGIPKLAVSGKLYPGVDVTMNGFKYRVDKVINYVTLYEKDGEIKSAKFVPEEIR